MVLMRELLELERKIQAAESEEEDRKEALKTARQRVDMAVLALRMAVRGEEQPDLPFPPNGQAETAPSPPPSEPEPAPAASSPEPPAQAPAPAPASEFDELAGLDLDARGVALSEILLRSTVTTRGLLARAELTTIGHLYDFIRAGHKLTEIKGVGPGKAQIIEEEAAAWLRRRFEAMIAAQEANVSELEQQPEQETEGVAV
jgi:hypothetical protein